MKIDRKRVLALSEIAINATLAASPELDHAVIDVPDLGLTVSGSRDGRWSVSTRLVPYGLDPWQRLIRLGTEDA